MVETVIALVSLLLGAALGAALMVARGAGIRAELADARARLSAAGEREAQAAAELARQQERIAAEQELLRDQFRAFTADAARTLAETQERRLAAERTTQHAEAQRREETMRRLVDPMARALDEVRRSTTDADKARTESEARLTAQVRALMDASEKVGRETAGLKAALRRPEVRGRWGELHLRRVVEVAGLVHHVDFVEQATDTDEEGRRLRPDMLVHLAGGRTVVVDAKTPFDAILDLEDQDVDRDETLDRHVDAVRKRVLELKGKAYTSQVDSRLEFVVLFMPAESFLQLALERDPRLQEWAWDHGVVIATPTILVALLRTIAHAWRETALAENAQQVLSTGRELYERLTTMGGHLARLGKQIDSASKAYNDTIGAFERRVLPSARRMGTLQQLDSEFAAGPIDTEIREITAADVPVEAEAEALGRG
ncbi:DNA recombination protein RmuC [Demequina mangrovi]|uniref:DNA recombination protein RmuC n=1 Tax=Demequina mangrovi TaxID=1043493 RepID=A0A1H6Y3C7_9MICO|nr:DNA recombination protein RmuC [Demequina mangrovi]SEJ34946.1 DNA recombination protein RmuC [Demequina mangrovi]